jgi:hypothetical protein
MCGEYSPAGVKINYFTVERERAMSPSLIPDFIVVFIGL